MTTTTYTEVHDGQTITYGMIEEVNNGGYLVYQPHSASGHFGGTYQHLREAKVWLRDEHARSCREAAASEPKPDTTGPWTYELTGYGFDVVNSDTGERAFAGHGKHQAHAEAARRNAGRTPPMSEAFMDRTELFDRCRPGGPMRLIGKGGNIASWNVLILADAIVYGRDDDAEDGPVYRHDVPNYGTSIGALAERPGFRLGWALMEDDAEILFCYDRDDGGFGYALNLTAPGCSEWGYSPFARDDDAPEEAA